MQPRALILHANGSNRDREAAQAFGLAGAQPEIVHLNQLRARERQWRDYQMLVLPGGFSYADALGAGKLLALDLNVYFVDEVRAFVDSGRPVIGICNGFQALVKAGLLPDYSPSRVNAATAKENSRYAAESATLTFNASGHFECRWVTLVPRSETCLWTCGLHEEIYCPVAHGEGQFILAAHHMLFSEQVALTYAYPNGEPARGEYPFNPNGSVLDIAGICNPRGNVLGLMPHPEDHIFAYQHPRWSRGERGKMGLPLFRNGVGYASRQ